MQTPHRQHPRSGVVLGAPVLCHSAARQCVCSPGAWVCARSGPPKEVDIEMSCVRRRTWCLELRVMEKAANPEAPEGGGPLAAIPRGSERTSPYRYTKEELLEMKEYPCSNERPECLLEKYDSDGVWDPEKWHASLYPSSERSSPVEGYRKDYPGDDRVPLKRRMADPRDRLKEEDLDVVLSPQRRSFGGGCQGTAALGPQARRAVSPLENKENESLRLGAARRIGSGRIMAARGFEREARGEKEARERDFKDKRFRRDFGDKRVFSERRRNDSYTEEEPEWFSAGPTSQSETIELIGFDDKVLEEEKRRSKRSRKRSESVKEAVECNGGLAEEPEAEVCVDLAADQEVPRRVVLAEPGPGDFDFNEFFDPENTVPGLASMIEDVLGERPVLASRFSRWFSSNVSPSGSRSSSLRSTPHEELERLAGLEQRCISPSLAHYFAPIQSAEEKKEKDKVDILELLQKARIDLKPLLSSLSANKERLRESSHSGVVLSLEEVEVGLKGLKVEGERPGAGTPFMAEHLEEALAGGTSSGPRPGPARPKDGDMSAFNKLVSTMKASGTLPTQPKANQTLDSQFVPSTELPPQKNILQEILGPQVPPPPGSPSLLGGLLGQRGPSPPLFRPGAPSPDYFPLRVQPPAGFPAGAQPLLADSFPEVHRPLSPRAPQQMSSLGLDQATLEALAYQQDLALQARQLYQQGFGKLPQDKCRESYRSRQPRMTRSPGPGVHRASSSSPGSTVTSMLSPSFTPTSVIRKMYESKEKSKEESGPSRPESKEDGALSQEDGSASPSSFLDGAERSGSPGGGGLKPAGFARSACSTPVSSQARAAKETERPARPAGRRTPTLVSPGPGGSPFPRPLCPMPMLSHVPLVRPPPPQLHPSVVQRMLAQGVQPHQLPPALLQAGIFPPGVDLSQLHGLPAPLLGQPFYPLGVAGHPLLPPRAGTPLHLAVLQQQLQQQQRSGHAPGPQLPGSLPQSSAPHRTNPPPRRGGSPPAGLAKWFGSDVLQQPLPSMPAKVISVDELEFRQ
ncbi:eukaryotic translation initiation factor 4E transporter isoform X2 [Lepisosteus oculatus]|uniref:eukaryotic translation initiation factor 4E transporter isoform X2 n=1 Tax=Lepisosteus oculatus TaxID=7918 RepID=UPI0035F52E1E